MRYSDPYFEELDCNTLERSKDIVFLVDSEFRIKYCNPAWDEFALGNGGNNVVAARVLGTDLMRVVPDPLRDFYNETFRRCRENQLTFDIDYECNSPELYRLWHMSILPLRSSGGLALVNSLRIECAFGTDRTGCAPSDIYFSSPGMVNVCCHCRRTERQDATGMWDWVPAFVNTREWKISHGMCPVCVSYFYSKYLTKGANSSSG